MNREIYDNKNKEDLKFKSELGLSEEIVRLISKHKNEPEWMLNKRLEALKIFNSMKMPDWGPSLDKLNLEDLYYFMSPNAKKNQTSWEEVPDEIRDTYEKLGIPKAERKALAGVGAQYESEVVYHNLKKKWADKGVVFLDCDEALKTHPELFKKYFMTTCVSPYLHKFAALHAAVWSGGTFIYVPKGVKLEIPLQAYFRMNAEKGGQFEHTLIIVDEGAECHYIEGCSAPRYDANSLHAGCVEIHVHKNARMRYSSIENWSKNTFNLNTKRALVHENSVMEWVNGNLGSDRTMLYPTSVLIGNNSQSHYLGVAFAGPGQWQDTGCKVHHIGKNTSSTIVAKSLSKDGGITAYRGLLSVSKEAKGAKCSVNCDTLMFGEGTSNTYPYMDIKGNMSQVVHEAKVGKISEEKLFYLKSRGLSEEEATQLVVSGFIEPIVKELPLEYAVELNRLIKLEMEGSLG